MPSLTRSDLDEAKLRGQARAREMTSEARKKFFSPVIESGLIMALVARGMSTDEARAKAAEFMASNEKAGKNAG
jgi:hypothetical protein